MLSVLYALAQDHTPIYGHAGRLDDISDIFSEFCIVRSERALLSLPVSSLPPSPSLSLPLSLSLLPSLPPRNPDVEINASNYWEECFSVATDTTPAFLLKGLERILLAGKSMHLIESIGKLRHIQEGMVHTSPSKGGVVSPRGGNALVTSPPGPTSDLYQFVRTLSQQMPPPVPGLVRSHDPTRPGTGGGIC